MRAVINVIHLSFTLSVYQLSERVKDVIPVFYSFTRVHTKQKSRSLCESHILSNILLYYDGKHILFPKESGREMAKRKVCEEIITEPEREEHARNNYMTHDSERFHDIGME